MIKPIFILTLLVGGLVGCGSDDDAGISFTRTGAVANASGGTPKAFDDNAFLAEQYSIVAGDGRACSFGVLNAFNSGYLKCWGRRIIGDYVSENVTGSSKMLSIGADHVCTTLSDFGGRRVGCAGDNRFGQTIDPEVASNDSNRNGHWLEKPYVLASGDNHNCAVDAFGVYCWGDNAAGQTSVPTLLNPKWVAAGGNTSCAIDGNDALHCWGANHAGQLTIPENLGSVSHVAVGSDFVCAISAGQVTCWGNTQGSAWQAPGTFTDAIFISAGQRHACVLDQAQARSDTQSGLVASCFGEDNSDQTLLAVPTTMQDNIRAITAGHGFTCAKNVYDGEDYLGSTTHYGIHCWGENAERQAVSPDIMCANFHKTAEAFEDRFCPVVN